MCKNFIDNITSIEVLFPLFSYNDFLNKKEKKEN